MRSFSSSRKFTNILLIFALLFTLSCSKQKKGVVPRLYHNTTSFFNGYYNAQELFRETVKRIENQYVFPEAGFISIAYYGNEQQINSYKTDLEKIIEKNDVVIYKHPNGNFVDDCRLLTGKAWFYKQNYTLAQQNFDEVIFKYPKSRILPEVWLWVARNHYMMGNPEMAISVIQENLVRKDSTKFDKRLKGELAIFKTMLNVENEQYESAARNLEYGIEHVQGRDRKARAHFLLAQLYAEIGNFPKALENFTLVPRYASNYDIAFQSKIRIAKLYVDFQEGKDDDQKVNDYLKKLLKDEKNLEYQDQIYYAFALLDLKKENLPGAISYLRFSIDANVNNTRQKALSYYKTGQIYFYEMQNYVQAQAYFDSASQVITPSAPEYKEIRDIGATLKKYVQYKNIIQYQDSMLYLASLSAPELQKIIEDLAAEEARKKREQEEKELEQMAQNNNPFQNQFNQQNRNNQQNQNTGGGWYFDNPASISNGRLQFEQIWGKRQSRDNWRRSRASSGISGPVTSDEGSAATEIDSAMVKQYGDKAKYYKDIPKNADDEAKANSLIEEALFNLATLYHRRLNEADSAIKTYELLLDRYENTDFTLRTRYALYQLYKEKDDPIYHVHEGFILNEYPNTIYALLIQGRDPSELKASEEDFKYVYRGLFNAYQNGEYETSLGFSEFLLSEYTGQPEVELDRLNYIRGMSYGYVGELDSLKAILSRVIKSWPDSDVTPLAQKILNELKNVKSESGDESGGGISGVPGMPNKAGKGEMPDQFPDSEDPGSEKPAGEKGASLSNPNNPRYEGFSIMPKPNDRVFVLMYFDKNNISKNDATVKLSNFNNENFGEQQLKVFTFMYEDTHLLPYISKFDDYTQAKKYIDALTASPVSQEMLQGESEKAFYISHSNFKIAYGQKRIPDYLAYYENIILPANK